MDELNLTYNALTLELTIYPINSSRLHNITEVVRCEDCKYYYAEHSVCEHERWMDAEGWSKSVDPDEFCSRGERCAPI